VSYSVVRTCARCGTRSEHDIRGPEGLGSFVSAVIHHFEHPDSDQGCPNCDPEVAAAFGSDGRGLEEWRAGIGRARSRSPV
jgi:hypothetical protein